jgi:hypothetical protein
MLSQASWRPLLVSDCEPLGPPNCFDRCIGRSGLIVRFACVKILAHCNFPVLRRICSSSMTRPRFVA